MSPIREKSLRRRGGGNPFFQWHSPQLLMVSGVGPSPTLQQHGINVVADLPGVGQNE